MSIALRLALATTLVAATAVALVPGAGVAGATSPAITVTVDGRAVADGNTTLIETDPTVGITVDAEQSIRVVSVRLDGTTERRYTPNATTVEESFELPVASGEHDLDVVVKAGNVTTHSVTVTKDAERPYVRYTTPFETDRYAPPPRETTVNRSRVVLGGNFTDVTGVTHLRIVRTTDYAVGGTSRTDRDVYEASGFDGSFEQPIFLDVGANNVTAWYYDRMGHARVHDFRIVVEDTAPPSLFNLSAVRPSSSTLRISGEATDNGQIRSVSVHPVGQAGVTYLRSPGTGAADADRRAVAFDRTVSLYPGATAVVVNATDTAGNSVERTVSVRRTVAPELRFDRSRTRFVDGGRIVVAGGATDGEIADATVETVDPASGEVVDIASVHGDGTVTDLAFERRLAAPEGRTVTLRLRVIDAAGTEHVVELNRTRRAETPTPPTTTPPSSPTATATPPPSPTPTPAANATAATNGTAGLTLPLVGVTVPVPDALGASVALPVPVVGPIDLPVAPVALLIAVGLGVVGRRR
jgi:hypothetical protein